MSSGFSLIAAEDAGFFKGTFLDVMGGFGAAAVGGIADLGLVVSAVAVVVVFFTGGTPVNRALAGPEVAALLPETTFVVVAVIGALIVAIGLVELSVVVACVGFAMILLTFSTFSSSFGLTGAGLYKTFFDTMVDLGGAVAAVATVDFDALATTGAVFLI